MKTFLSYPTQYERGEGVHYARVLRRMGHEVVEVNVAAKPPLIVGAGRMMPGLPPETTMGDLLAAHGGGDLFLYVDPGGMVPRGMEVSPIPTACVLCDTHRDLKSRVALSLLFDHVFLYHRNYLSFFGDRVPGTAHWLPYACDKEFMKDLGCPRNLDVAFIGNLFGADSERRDIMEEIRRRYVVNEDRSHAQDEISGVYSRAKIVLNLPLGDDLNFRFFEALSCGAMLLTRRCNNGQEDLFREGTHFAAFGDRRELFEKLEYYLGHDDERTRIAAAGHAEALAKHTLEMRLKTLLEKAAGGRNAPARSMPAAAVTRLYAAVYEKAGQVDALLRLAAEASVRGRLRMAVLGRAAKSFFRRAVHRW